MGEYIYKTLPSSVREVTIKLSDGTIVNGTCGEYAYAYKPYLTDEKENRKMDNRYVAPARRAFKISAANPPKYGAHIGKEHPRMQVGDTVFAANQRVALSDFYMNRVGFIINLAPNGRDERTLAQKINPDNYGHVTLCDYVGKVLMHDYKAGEWTLTGGGDPMDSLPHWKAKLDPQDLFLFENMERSYAK